MIIKECLFSPFLIDHGSLRRGILLTLTNAEGHSATAEISPLPGYSKETIEEVYIQLTSVKKKLLNNWWTKGRLHNLSHLGLYPSVYFGIESALMELLDPPSSNPIIESYALFLGSHTEILERADDAHKEGFTEAKIKLGHLTPEIGHTLIEKLQDKFRLRLDLNRKWSLSETETFCAKYPKETFTYIEEPVSNPEDLFQFSHPFALDETLRSSPLSSFLHLENFTTLILKPTMLYPLTPYLQLGKKIVLTSSFEGPLGIGQIKKLIARLGLHATPHGLDTLRYQKPHDPLPHHPLEKAAP